MNNVIFSFVCTVNSSLEVFRPLDLFRASYSLFAFWPFEANTQCWVQPSKTDRQTRLLPLYVPRSHQEGDWTCVPSRQMHTAHHCMAAHTTPNTHTNTAQCPHHPPLSGWRSIRENGPEWILPAAGLKHWACYSFHAWLSCDSPGRALCSLGLLNWCSCLPLCPCAPTGLWR